MEYVYCDKAKVVQMYFVGIELSLYWFHQDWYFGPLNVDTKTMTNVSSMCRL